MIITVFTEVKGQFYRRTLPFDEIEIEYSDADYSIPIEMDIRNVGLKAHLELKEEGSIITVSEYGKPQEENVFFVEINGDRVHASQLKKIDKILSEYKYTNLLK